MSGPVLAFVCGVCRHALDMTCPACQRREQEELGYQSLLDQQARNAEEAARRAIPGLAGLEDFFDCEVRMTYEADEDGECSPEARMRLPWGDVEGVGKTAEEAVKNLRAEIIKDLRDTADALENEEVAS